MKLTRATIDGFGKWYDESFDFSTGSLTCLYGENESGKSTLHAFILFMLFGLPPKGRVFYRPKTGAKMGGRLTIHDDKIGEFTIERFDEKQNGAAICYTDDGQQFDEDWLNNRLKGMTHQTYQSIYSFSAVDLIGLNEMNEADLGDVLLSIGLTGSKHIHKIEKRLDTQLADLFKPYGKKPAINQQIATLDELHASLATSKKEEATYRDKKETVHTLTVDIKQIKNQLQQDKHHYSQVEKNLQALPLIHQYHHYTDQLATNPVSMAFPEDGLNRMNALMEQLLPIQSELSVLRHDQQKYRDKQQQLKSELHEHAIYDEAKHLLEQSTTYLEKEKELVKLDEVRKKKLMQIDSALNQLNVGIKPDDLRAISLTFHIEHTWNMLANDINQNSLERDQLEQEKRVAVRNRKELDRQQEEITSHLLSQQRVSTLTDIIHAYKQQGYIQSMKDDTKKNQQKWRQIKEQKEKTGVNILVGSIVLAIFSGVSGWLFDYNNLYSIMIIIIVVGIGQWLWGKRSIHEMEQIMNEHEQPTEPGVSNTAYKEAESLLAVHKKNEAELATIQEKRKANDVQFLQITERQNALELKESRIQQQIKNQTDTYPFLRKIDVSYWATFYHSLKQVLQLHAETKEIEDQYSILQDSQKDFLQNINRFLHERNWELSNKAVEDHIALLEKFANDYCQTFDLIEQYDDWIAENKELQETWKQKMHVFEKEREALYEAADVETEEGFFQKAKQWEERQQNKLKLTEVTEQLLARFSQGEWEKVSESRLQEQELETERDALLSSIQMLEVDLDEKRQQLAAVNATLAHMETSDTYSWTLHRFNMEQEQLETLARDWAVLKTAKELLRETKRNYQDKYLTKVIEKTSGYFAALTNNKYKQVLAPTAGRLFQVVASDDLHYTVKELSQGATDQLYVSLRLAIGEAMSEKHQLPFIIDDAFVHFDSFRTEKVMKVLMKIAKNQQVILFTCKKDITKTVHNEKIVHLGNTVRIS